MLPFMTAASRQSHLLNLLTLSRFSRFLCLSFLSSLSWLSCLFLCCLSSRVSGVGAIAAGPTKSGALQGSTLLLPTSCFLALKVPPLPHSRGLLSALSPLPFPPSHTSSRFLDSPSLRGKYLLGGEYRWRTGQRVRGHIPSLSFSHLPPNLSPHPPFLTLPVSPVPVHLRPLLPVQACDFAFNGSLGFVPLYSLETMQPNAPFSDGVLHSSPPPPVPPSLPPLAPFPRLSATHPVVPTFSLWKAPQCPPFTVVLLSRLNSPLSDSPHPHLLFSRPLPNCPPFTVRKLPKCPSFTVVLPSSSSDSPTIRLATAAPITNSLSYSGACFILSFAQLVLKLGSGPKAMVRLSPADGNLQFPDVSVLALLQQLPCPTCECLPCLATAAAVQ
ncbi:unnamed protein product [Closterium sp. Naga37s-1]|nr:unnamed protein product [Closterium sp. Naga37s-1]